jgi:hypothetical protein
MTLKWILLIVVRIKAEIFFVLLCGISFFDFCVELLFYFVLIIEVASFGDSVFLGNYFGIFLSVVD